MSKVNSNVKFLKAFVAPKSNFKQQQLQVVQLYQDRKIESVRTAEKIIEQLHSRGDKKNQQGLAALSKYTTAIPVTGKISRQLASKQSNLDNSMELKVEQTASALNSKVKEVTVNFSRIGSKVSIFKVLTQALNQALKKVGNDKISIHSKFPNR